MEDNKQTTLDDVLFAVNDFAEKTEKRFDKVETGIKEIKSTMVTKNYLDDKLADLKGDMVVLMRKEDTKMKTLVEILTEKKVLNLEDKKRIFALEPFPEMSI